MSYTAYLKLALAPLVFLGWARSANADFSVCNLTEETLSFAVAQQHLDTATSYGWWVITPNQCQLILKGMQHEKKLFGFASHHRVGGEWSGAHSFCTDITSFEIGGSDNCISRGFQLRGFFEIETGGSGDLRYDFIEPMNRNTE